MRTKLLMNKAIKTSAGLSSKVCLQADHMVDDHGSPLPELQSLIMAATTSQFWLPTFLLLDAAAGCRRGELLALTWNDVDLQKGILTISKSLAQTKNEGLFLKPPNGRKARSFSLPKSAITALKEFQRDQLKNASMFGHDYCRSPNLIRYSRRPISQTRLCQRDSFPALSRTRNAEGSIAAYPAP